MKTNYENVVFEIGGYSKKTEFREFEILLKDARPVELLEIFPEAAESGLMMGYDIDQEKAQQLSKKYEIQFDFEKYDYFLEAFQKEA